MADKGRRGDSVFFVYDHNMLKKEEDDLKDAILFFTPNTYTIDDQCALCGQLMGMSEFLTATLSSSAPRIFRFDYDKFALKCVGAYSFGIKGGSFIPDSLLHTQLTSLYEVFVTYHGSIDSLKLRCKDSTRSFLQELDNIWKTILEVSAVFRGYSLAQTFQSLPYVQLPQSGSHLFLQGSHLLQSSQRRPYVLAGTILYKNRVLSTQLPPGLTRHLTYLHNQMPHIVRKTECELPVGCRIITVFLTDEELSEIDPLDSLARHHCKVTDFSVCRESDRNVMNSTNATTKQSKSMGQRRLTCPNLSVPAVPQKALHSYMANEQRKTHHSKQESVPVDNLSWKVTSRLLSHVPIVECKCGESPVDSDGETLYHAAKELHVDDVSYKQVESTINYENEQSESDTDTEDMILDSNTCQSSRTKTNRDKMDDDQTESQSTPLISCKEIKPLVEGSINAKTRTESFSGPPINCRENQPLSDETKTVELSTKCGSKQKTDCNELVSDYETENSEKSLKLHLELPYRTGDDKTDLLAEMEDNQSDKLTRSTETINLSENIGTAEQVLNILEKTNLGDIVRKSLEVTLESQSILENHAKETENPSISDLDEESDEDIPVSKTRIENLSLTQGSSSSSKDCKSENETENKFNMEQSKDDATAPSAVGLSTSSDESANARFYDHIPDDQTKTLKTNSNHAIHQHVVDVHVASNTVLGSESTKVSDDQNGQRGLEKVSISTISSSGNSCDQDSESDVKHSVTRVCEQISAADTDSLETIKINESEFSNFLTLNNTDIEVANGKNDGINKLHEVKHINKDEVEHGQMLHCIRNGKENLNPNILVSHSPIPDIHRHLSESEIETEDESVSIATIEPCINCLDLQAEEKYEFKMIRCSQCIAKFNKQRVFGTFRTDQEILDFGGRIIDRYESGAETEGDTERRGSGQAGSSLLSSLSSDLSTESTISRYWTHEMDGLNDVTLYVQCHSEISLLLLMENPDQYEEDLFYSLWKGSLAYLADLDFYIKECTEECDDVQTHSKEMYGYLKYDPYTADLRGTIKDPGNDRMSNNLHQMLASLHTEFQQEQCLSEVTLRSHLNSCYGHSNHVEETYFQSEFQPKLLSGFPIPRDPVFNLDMVARQRLAKDKHLSLL